MPKKIVTPVTVEHRRDGCPIERRRDEHTHTQRDWRKAVDAADPWKRGRR